MQSSHAEICVIGGGPAGSALALRLAQLGHDVLLIERDRFPRHHVGEAFASGIDVPLARLGVVDQVRRAAAVETAGTMRLWATTAVECAPPGSGRAGIVVDRGEFDKVLLDRAQACGVRVVQPASVIGAHRSSAGWILRLRCGSSAAVVSTRYVADASGRAGVLRGATRRTSPKTAALSGYWSSCRRDPFARLEAGPDAWYWGTHLPGKRFVGMVFCDVEGSRRRPTIPRETRYGELIRRSTLLAPVVAGASLDRVMVRDATSRAAAEPIGPDWIRVGEASFAIDPLSSSGVQKALQTALTAAIVLHTQVTWPEDAEAAMAFYRDDQRFAIGQHAAWAASAYAQVEPYAERPFWRSRAAGATRPVIARVSGTPPRLEQRVRVAPETRLGPVPCIVGDRIQLRAAVSHPGLARPVAFLDDVEVAPLVASVAAGLTGDQLAARWMTDVPIATAQAIARWLIERGILVGTNG